MRLLVCAAALLGAVSFSACSACGETPAAGDEGEGDSAEGEGEGEGDAGEGEGEGEEGEGDGAPVVTIAAPSDGDTFRQGQSVSFRCAAVDPDGDVLDNSAFRWSSSLDGPLGVGAEIANALLVAGTHTLTCSVTDGAGNVGSASVDVDVLDNAVPVVAIVAPADGGFFLPADSIGFRGDATDADDGVLSGAALRWTDNGADLGAGALVTTALPLGVHEIVLTATDSDGAAVSDSITVTVTDNLPPVCSIARPDTGDVVIAGESVDLVASCDDPDGVGAIANASYRWSSDLQGQLGFGATVTEALVVVGDHVVTVCAADTEDAAVSGCASVTLTVRANTPPTAAIAAPAGGAVVEACAVVDLVCDVADADGQRLTVRWLDNDVEVASGADAAYTPVAGGARTLRCEATDPLGGTATATTTLTVLSPSVAITAPDDGAAFAPGQTFTLRGDGCSAALGDLAGAQLTWRDGNAALGTGDVVVVTGGLAAGHHDITLTADDGVAQRTASLVVFVSTPPTATITAPADGVTVDSGAATAFAGSANDAEDGAIEDAVWADSTGGVFGSGATASTTLAPGKHVVRLTATDSAGLTGSDTVTVFATPGAAPFSTLFDSRALAAAVVDVAIVGDDVFLATQSGVVRTTADLSAITLLTTATSDLPSNAVRDIAVREDGSLVVATADGLAVGCDRDLACDGVLDDGADALRFQTNDMRAVGELSDGRLVVGTSECLVVVAADLQSGREFCEGDGGGDRAESDQVRRLAVAVDDTVLIAWGGDQNAASSLTVGADLQNRANAVFDHIDRGDGLPSATVTDVAFGPAGERVFATNAGVATADGGSVVVVNAQRGLPSNEVRAVAIDVIVSGGVEHVVVWAATAGGLGRIDAGDGSVVGLTTADGLPSNDLRAVAVDAASHEKTVGTGSGAFVYRGF